MDSTAQKVDLCPALHASSTERLPDWKCADLSIEWYLALLPWVEAEPLLSCLVYGWQRVPPDGYYNPRQLVNENDVISLLNQYEFESFEPGRLSLEDQVRLFANADVVIGPHGAGLTNIIYGSSLKVL